MYGVCEAEQHLSSPDNETIGRKGKGKDNGSATTHAGKNGTNGTSENERTNGTNGTERTGTDSEK